MNIDLTGKTAVVTASTGGIGLAVAQGLAACGASIVINGRRTEAVDAAVAAVKATGAKATGVTADMSTADGAAAALIAAAPACDILVNNAAFIGVSDVFEASDELWEQAFQTNVMTGVRLARHYMPGMEAAGWGRVVFVSSESARNLNTMLIPYGASKLALHALSRGLAKRMAGTGVTSNVVIPGPTLSDLLRPRLEAAAAEAGRAVEDVAADFVTKNRPSSILRRMATVDEVASMITYVCSPQAAAVTGAALRVDGGVIDDVG